MPTSEPLVAATVGCPSCGAPAEPETEDGVLKHVCTLCEFEFGFRYLEQGENACSLGIEQEIREHSHRMVASAGGVFLGGIGRRPA